MIVAKLTDPHLMPATRTCRATLRLEEQCSRIRKVRCLNADLKSRGVFTLSQWDGRKKSPIFTNPSVKIVNTNLCNEFVLALRSGADEESPRDARMFGSSLRVNLSWPVGARFCVFRKPRSSLTCPDAEVDSLLFAYAEIEVQRFIRSMSICQIQFGPDEAPKNKSTPPRNNPFRAR